MRYYFILILTLFIMPMCAQDSSSLNTYTFLEAEKRQQQESRPYIIFMYTDWCRYCHGMKKNTLNTPEVIRILNKAYYFIAFDVEEKKDILFAGRKFTYKPNGAETGGHELAGALGSIDGKLSFPTIVLLNTQNEIIFQYGAFMSSRQLLETLNNGLK